ncbi:MAG TPA: CHAT domain-containing protein [Phenylobacterium sp.]|nr:CHAT domain-containing protein [Phenylobacterium sp.]
MLAAIGVGCGAPALAQAATTPAALCTPSTTAAPSGPSSDALARAAGAAETLLARRSAGVARADSAFSELTIAETGDRPPAEPELAAYCSAAGESMRLSSNGSQLQAQTYLLAAVRYAESSRTPGVAALAAYRLSLATVGGPAAGDSRGGTRARAASLVEAAPSTAEGCAALLQPAVLNRANSAVTLAALTCALERAQGAGETALAGLAGLRLSRFLLTNSEASPSAAPLREAAGATAAELLGPVAAGGAPNAELTGRLVEAAIDGGRAADPRLPQAIAAMRKAAPNDTAIQAFAFALEGRLALARGDRAAAVAALQQAVFLESQLTQPLRMSDWLLHLADAEPQRRVELVTAAYRALESVRPLMPVVDPLTEESTFALRMRPVFERAVDVQLGEGAAGVDVVRISNAQQIIEAYRQAEVQNALGVDCVPPRKPVDPSELRAGEILLYPILLPGRVELIYAVGGEGATTYRRLPPNAAASRQRIAGLVAQVTDALGRSGDEAWRSASRELYDLLIQPIEPHLTGETTLVIIPDSGLRGLPFAALMDGRNRFLVERTRLSIAPALSYSQPGLERESDRLAVVAASLQQEVQLPAGYFPALEGAADEARVAAGLDGAAARPGRFIPDFHRADLEDALSGRRVDVLHLATHAAFNGRSDRSFIVANGEAISLSALRGLISENRSAADELDLLVLSACETAVGDDQASMGLAGAAVQAGARSALASLWQVDDAGTVVLMKAFYENYRGGQSKAEALRNAQLALIGQGGALANPNIWGAFTLLGGWR